METKIGQQIQKLRKSKNMSQEKLAEKLEVSRHSISNWEREVNNPDLKTILEITKLFNISLNQLIKGVEIMEINKYVYSAFAIFLGGFGAHKFYIKKINKQYFTSYFVGVEFLA
ncbi:helix-turn-helix domain-containing protein [Staphylococcus haemolyticus]|uniref:helix-turn-helix domain-containing protein n=1 Tax=Staphylococcus haemolyticus TaxID=1283 RepID=UPI0034D7B8B3